MEQAQKSERKKQANNEVWKKQEQVLLENETFNMSQEGRKIEKELQIMLQHHENKWKSILEEKAKELNNIMENYQVSFLIYFINII